ncbi:MAG: sulfite exporter TauE/SafE family protein [Spirosomataceae bacterium]
MVRLFSFGNMDFSHYHITPLGWFLAIISAFIIGLSKSGISSISLITVSLLAYVFGGKNSTGVLLPMLSFADVFAVVYYHRHTQWKYLYKLLPWMIVGILLGVWFGKDISDVIFKKAMAFLVFLTAVSMIWWERNPKREVPQNWKFASVMGLGAGFTTMLGNMAGAFSNLYFLAMRLPKEHFIGTASWLFLIINAFKIPFHVFVWHTVSVKSISLNLALLPFLLIGFFVGIRIVRVLKEDRYRKMVMILTATASVFLILSL